MTKTQASAALAALKARGITVALRAGKVTTRGRLTPADRALLKTHSAAFARALGAEPTCAREPEAAPADPEALLDAILREEREEDEREGDRLLSAMFEAQAREAHAFRLAQLGALEAPAVRRLVRAGRLGASDVRDWREARRDRLRRAQLADAAMICALRVGARVREVVDEFGRVVAVEVVGGTR